MKYPENIYVASADPMHYSHFNTMQVAEKKLGQAVDLVICKNGLKSNGLFCITERREIANLYLPEERICFAESYEEIRAFLINAKKIVRGVRGEEDLKYMKKLAKFYNVESLENKLMLVQVPKRFCYCSSTKIKEHVMSGNLSEARKYCKRQIVSMIRERYAEERSRQLVHSRI